MSQLLLSLSVWLHSLATVVFIGHYVLLAVIYLPAMTRSFAAGASGNVLVEISKGSRTWLYASLVVLAITGTYLTVVDPKYLGLGDFGNAWAALMLVKHILILGMLGAGFWFNAILKAGSMLGANPGSAPMLNRYRLFVNGMAISGVLVLLLTALAQIQ